MKLRSERRKRIVELRNEGKTIAEIRSILGMDRNNLASTLAQMRKAGLPCITTEEAVKRQKEAVRKRGCDPKLILDLHNAGHSQDAIAQQLNQKRGYVARILKNVQKQETEQFRNKLIELYNRGIPYKSMALILNTSIGCCAVTVNRLVKKGQLTLRGPAKQYETPRITKQETTEGFIVLPIPLKPTRTYKRINAPTQTPQNC